MSLWYEVEVNTTGKAWVVIKAESEEAAVAAVQAGGGEFVGEEILTREAIKAVEEFDQDEPDFGPDEEEDEDIVWSGEY